LIYYVEDDCNIRELVIYTLSQSELPAEGFSSGKQFFASCEKVVPELVLLDIMLPDEDGLDILKKIKTIDTMRNVPVIMVTAKGSEYDKVIGLNLGADDYISKPFGMMELVARIRARLRRKQPVSVETKEIIERGNIVLNSRKHVILHEGKELSLTLKEFELLAFFLKNPGVAFERNHLLEKVWGYEFAGETRTIDVHIQTLRQKLGTSSYLIETVRGVGYRFKG